MGQQLKIRTKRRRRKAYLVRRKELEQAAKAPTKAKKA